MKNLVWLVSILPCCEGSHHADQAVAHIIRLPSDVSAASLVAVLEQVCGKARFDNLQIAVEYNANHICLQLNWGPMKQAEEWAADLDGYDKWLDGALSFVEALG